MSLYDTVTLVGTKVHYERTHRVASRPSCTSRSAAMIWSLKTRRACRCALSATFDKAKVKPCVKDSLRTPAIHHWLRDARQAGPAGVIHRGGEPETDEYKALTVVRDALLGAVPLNVWLERIMVAEQLLDGGLRFFRLSPATPACARPLDRGDAGWSRAL